MTNLASLMLCLELYNHGLPVRFQVLCSTKWGNQEEHVLNIFFFTFYQRYIVKCQNNVQPPAYLTKPDGQRVTFDFSAIMSNEESDDHEHT